MKKFVDLDDAFNQLKDNIPSFKNNKEGIFIGVCDTQVFYSAYLAYKLHQYTGLGFDSLFLKKIYSPINRSCIIGIISETGQSVTNDVLIDYLDIQSDYIFSEIERKYESLSGSSHRFKENDLANKVKGNTVYLVDYGMYSGLNMLCAIKSVIEQQAATVHIITPIIFSTIFNHLYSIVDNIYYVHKEDHFVDKDFYYEKLNNINYESIGCTI